MRSYTNAKVKKILTAAGIAVSQVNHRKNVYYIRIDDPTLSLSAKDHALKVMKVIQEHDPRFKVSVCDYNTDKIEGTRVKFYLTPNEELVETENLMTGETVSIRADQKGTCCDPGTEAYWSM